MVSLHASFHNGSNGDYFQRPAERLVLEGYRQWSAGYETGSITPWEMAAELFSQTLGPKEGREALGELSHYVRTLRRCALCPLRAFPFNSRHLCLEECLTLGLIAGLQNDPDAAELCLSNITCRARCKDVAAAAEGLAEILAGLGHRLLPIPRHVIEDVVARSHPVKPSSVMLN